MPQEFADKHCGEAIRYKQEMLKRVNLEMDLEMASMIFYMPSGKSTLESEEKGQAYAQAEGAYRILLREATLYRL